MDNINVNDELRRIQNVFDNYEEYDTCVGSLIPKDLIQNPSDDLNNNQPHMPKPNSPDKGIC